MTAPPRTQAGNGRPIRVMVVDDSAVIRKIVTQTLEHDDSFEFVGSAPNGVLALQKLPQLEPDIVVLDVEMPEMDGIETLRHIRARYPDLKVVMFSTLTERGASVTIEALTLGASDYATKVSNTGGESSMAVLRNELLPKLKQFFTVHHGPHAGTSPRAVQTTPPPAAPARKPAPAAASPVTPTPRAGSVAPEAVVIGVSTGGPTALHEIVPEIPSNFPLPILIVQHMPPIFTKLLAERLATRARIPIVEACDGQPVLGGHAYVAPGDFHMRVTGRPDRPRIALDQGPQENSCRPAVDCLFRSAAEVWGSSTLAVVLTGMGSDGLIGCEILRTKGSYILAQDEPTSVVWGMPGFVARAGLADKVLPLSSIVPDILERCLRTGVSMTRPDLAHSHTAARGNPQSNALTRSTR